MRNITLAALATSVFLASSGVAEASPHKHHARVAASALCSASVDPAAPYTNPVTGAQEVWLGGRALCSAHVPLDVRVCPQLQINGQWVFASSADGYGTCQESGWATNMLTGLGGTRSCTAPGALIRTHVAAWWWYGGKQYSAVAIGPPVSCPVG